MGELNALRAALAIIEGMSMSSTLEEDEEKESEY